MLLCNVKLKSQPVQQEIYMVKSKSYEDSKVSQLLCMIKQQVDDALKATG